MQNVLIIICNPSVKSLSHGAAEQLTALRAPGKAAVRTIDLYAEQDFSPVLAETEIQRRMSTDMTVNRFVARLDEADILVFLHPDWWGSVPALLKGFIDRVFLPGVAFALEGPDFGSKQCVPLLAGKKAVIGITSDSPDGDHLQSWWYDKVLGYTGIVPGAFHFLPETRKSTSRERETWIRSICNSVMTLADE
ncbi:MAG: NAD(P)H-dependent oxidoreductase [Spirochaetales bacterium]|nr:NAD(P)H-dependent oxidoreductase [Spirochaetales bacterium]